MGRKKLNKIKLFTSLFLILFLLVQVIIPDSFPFKNIFAASCVCGDGYCNPACENPINCPEDCGGGACVCGDGYCNPMCENSYNCPEDCGFICIDECSYSGEKQTRCSSSRYLQERVCGNYDLDPCLEWSSWRTIQDCGVSGWTSEYRCSGNIVQRKYINRGCSNLQCFTSEEWQNVKDCSLEGKVCQSGECVLPLNDPVSGTLSVSPSTTSCIGEYVIFTISAKDNEGVEKVCLDSNCQSCGFQASCTKTWQITKNTPGTFSFSGTVFGKKPDGSQESAKTNPASISITWRDCNRPPIANAGPDKEVLETQSVVLEGSGSDPDSDPITFSWICSGGTLSNPNVAQPTFTAPAVSSDTTFSCTLTVTDSKGAQSSDTMNVLVRAQTLFVILEAIPNSGSAPLNNVDLKATVSGTAIGPITYKFDCTGDGTFERVITTNENPYTAVDLCNYYTGGVFNAKVYVERGAADPAWAQATVLVSSFYPTLDLKVNGTDGPIYVPYNSSITLSWVANNVTSCQASGDWSGAKTISGSEIISGITSNKNYILTCTGPFGNVSDSVTVYVQLALVPSVDLKVNGRDEFITIPFGSSATLTWTSSNTNYCYASGNWSGYKSLSGSELISNITSYKVFTITCSGPGGTVSDTVSVGVSLPREKAVSINKTVKNLSKGTEFLKRVEAEPNEVLVFGITITGGSEPLFNVIIKDVLPAGIIYRGELKINNVPIDGDILNGISLGSLNPGETKTITFKADIATAQNFPFGQTELTNKVIVSADGLSVSDEAKIIVTRKAVAGAITEIPAGIRDNIFFDSFFLPLLFAAISVWLFKSKIINFEKWLDLKKREAQAYKAKKLLQFKIAKFKVKNFFD